MLCDVWHVAAYLQNSVIVKYVNIWRYDYILLMYTRVHIMQICVFGDVH